jgi:molecular chaperone GrpE
MTNNEKLPNEIPVPESSEIQENQNFKDAQASSNAETDVNENAFEDSEEKSEVEHLNEQIKELNDKYIRLYAEFENFKKRVAKERIEFAKTAGREVILTFLPVLDDFERAIKSMENAQDLEAVKSGVQLIFKKFHDALEKLGVTPSDCQGEPFDPDKHEAVARVAAGPEKSGIIIDTVERGFMMHDKVLRFPKVVVGE